MLPHRLSFPRRLSSNRPFRPPNSTKKKPRPRQFTQNSQVLLISPPSPRPQLPFLYPSSGARLPQPRSREFQLSRLLSAENKGWVKFEFKLAGRIILAGSTLYVSGYLMIFGVQSEILEREFPSPRDWSLWSRVAWRNARGGEDPTRSTTGHIDYAYTGDWYTNVLDRLENPSIDGAGLEPALQDDGEIYVAGVGKAGLNISSMNEPWRRCYHTCLMGAARAAEHLEGWVTDTTRRLTFPANVVVGPSNPRPKPVPYLAAEAPLEENCVVAFGTPESYYTKLLTTQGFTTRQRLDAALAYADWLSYKGLPESAEAMYDWGLDIAAGALPVGAHNAVDIKSGIISADASYISPNLLDATTSLAIHHARNKNFAAAFPIFLSVLRATRELPSPPHKRPRDPFEIDSPKDSGLLAGIKSLLWEAPYPPAPPTGDEPQLRTPLAVCEEAGIMAHIGEIVFASALSTTNPASTRSTTTNKTTSQQNLNAGISWTRDAVDIAESTFLGPARRDMEAIKKCAQCINLGMGNWEKMVARMIKNAAPQQEQLNQPETGIGQSPPADTSARDNGGAGWNNWGPVGWLWGSSHHDESGDGNVVLRSGTEDPDGYGRWQREAELVREKRAKLRQMLRIEGLSDEDGAGPGVSSGMGWGLLFR